MLKQALPFLSQPAGMVISALLLAVKATSVAIRLCRPTRLDDLDSMTATREGNQAQDVNVIFRLCAEVHISKGKEMVRPAPLRANRHDDGFLLECSDYRPVWCSET